MENVTNVFPELVCAFAALEGNGLVDGEILAWRGGRALNFNVLQQRLARKQVKAALMAEVPVVFVAYDLLLRDNELLLDTPFEERRRKSKELFQGRSLPLLLSAQTAGVSHAQIDQLFLEARAR